jgi:hypothetical protein
MKAAQFILAVANQAMSTTFYEQMREASIKRLSGDALSDPGIRLGVPRAELCLLVEDAAPFGMEEPK